MVLLEDSSTASDFCDEDSAREYRKSGGSSGYRTALFRAGMLSTKSDGELLEQFTSASSAQDEGA